MNKSLISVLLLALFIIGCTAEVDDSPMMEMEHMDEDDASMQEHCKMMPNMPGCEKYAEPSEAYERDITGLEEAKKMQVLNPDDGETVRLSADIIRKKINGNDVRMFGYNGQIPGPVIKVRQGQNIDVEFTNNLDVETTVHWHGLRLENRFDGVPGLTQEPIKPGEKFTYTLEFPDEGIYWYHPHVREDYQQELGLYGTMIVEPEENNYYNLVNREEILIIDDILFGKNDLHPFTDSVSHALMGRFGNTMMVNGQESYSIAVNKGDTVRFYIFNTANTRTFNLSIPGTVLKLIGGDSGSYETEEYIDSVIISPSERYTIEALFSREGEYIIKSASSHKSYDLGQIIVGSELTKQDYSADFFSLRDNDYVKSSIEEVEEYFDKEIDATIKLEVEMNGMMHDMDSEGHAIEWEDDMAMMNEMMTNNSLRWVIKDQETGKENMDIEYDWKVGDKVKIRIINDPDSMHPMQHPVHFHGNRFLVLETDGNTNENLVWKDTVLVPSGSYADILLDISNPGDWMGHCHIAEHLQSMMMFTYHAN